MLVVRAHERLDAVLVRGEAEGRRDALLEVEGELVLVAVGGQVERVADAPEEVERRLQLADRGLGDQPRGSPARGSSAP